MGIMLMSLLLGSAGWFLGSLTNLDLWVISFSIIGFFLPPFYVLEKIHTNTELNNKKIG